MTVSMSRFPILKRFPLAAAFAALLIVAALPGGAEARGAKRAPVVILVSLDGFRADYLNRGITPSLNAIAARGISAAMRPAFPSKTFPNHWALVTGEYPDHNGIVGNTFEDPRRPDQTFTMQSDDPFWWNEAEPLWVAAEKAGIRSASLFWPGSNVGWGGELVDHGFAAVEGGTRPEDWHEFNFAVTNTQRVNAVLDWMRRPASIRPRFVTLYMNTVDTAGHLYGPSDPHINASIGEVDQQIGQLVSGLKALHQPANLIVVADHGMAAISSERVIALDKLLDPAAFRLVDSGPFAAIAPVPGHERQLEAALLKPHDHMQCWRKDQIPARLHFGTNPRIQPYFCLAAVGWEISETAPNKPFAGGSHGWDNAASEMAALFVAAGPQIRNSGRLAPFDNVDVEPMLRDLLGLPVNPKADGNDAPFRVSLKLSRR